MSVCNVPVRKSSMPGLEKIATAIQMSVKTETYARFPNFKVLFPALLIFYMSESKGGLYRCNAYVRIQY